jgi:hypothetical protein
LSSQWVHWPIVGRIPVDTSPRMASARINNELWMGVEAAMTSLSAAAIRHYHEHGYYSPLRALSAAEAAALRRHLEEYEGAGGTLYGPLRHKTHLLFTWLNDLIRRPSILDAVEDIIGAEHPLLGDQLFHQGGAHPQLRLLAPGQHLLGTGVARHRHCLGRDPRKRGGERRHAGDPGHTHRRPSGSSRHVRARQHAEPRPRDRGEGRWFQSR